VIRSLEEIAQQRGYPKMIRVDNGPEFISAKLDIWSKDKKIQLLFIEPGEPTQNAYIERLDGTFRRDILLIFTHSWAKHFYAIVPDNDCIFFVKPTHIICFFFADVVNNQLKEI
jgi:transposase InsO family protein